MNIINKEDFNRINEIAKDLNNIRLSNNLSELILTSSDRSHTHFEYHKEWNEVQLMTRNNNPNEYYSSCKFAYMKQDKSTNEIENMDYDKYINYK